MIDGSIYHVQGTIRSHASLGLAYVDDGRPLEGRSSQDPVGVVMAHDQIDGHAAGSSSLAYDTLAEAIRATSDETGAASAKDITKWLAERDREAGRARSTMTVDGVTKHGELSHVSTVPACPPGLVHPVIDYAFRLLADHIQVDYTVAKGVEIIPDERVAILDNDADGQAEPGHDSLLTYNARSLDGSVQYVGNVVPFERLNRALGDLGGRADEAALREQFSKLTMQPDQPFEVASFRPLPDPLVAVDRPVDKTFTQTPSGGIFVEYRLADDKNFGGGWNGDAD